MNKLALIALGLLRRGRHLNGIQFVTDEKGRKVGVLIDLKKHGAIWVDFWDGPCLNPAAFARCVRPSPLPR